MMEETVKPESNYSSFSSKLIPSLK